MDIITINQLAIKTTIGVYEWEKQIKQTLLLDIQFATDVKQAARHDKLEDSLDYDCIGSGVTNLISEGQFQLIETVAEQVAEFLLQEFTIPWTQVTVTKPHALEQAKGVSVTIQREAHS